MHQYNSTRDALLLKEYGRNIQKLVAEIGGIADRTARTQYVQLVLRTMGQADGPAKDQEENIRKRWYDLCTLAGGAPDVDLSYGSYIPKQEQAPAQKPAYSHAPAQFRHYGRYIDLLSQRAKSLPTAEERTEAFIDIACLMKQLSKFWHSDKSQDHDKIRTHLKKLAGADFPQDAERLQQRLDTFSYAHTGAAQHLPTNRRFRGNYKRR